MKKAIGVFVGALGMTILLSGSIVLGNAISSQDSKQQKLERIAEDKRKDQSAGEEYAGGQNR